MKKRESKTLSMEVFRKAFLFAVGLVAIAYEEAEKAVEEAVDAIEERTERLRTRSTQ